jgi:hypothetical protein
MFSQHQEIQEQKIQKNKEQNQKDDEDVKIKEIFDLCQEFFKQLSDQNCELNNEVLSACFKNFYVKNQEKFQFKKFQKKDVFRDIFLICYVLFLHSNDFDQRNNQMIEKIKLYFDELKQCEEPIQNLCFQELKNLHSLEEYTLYFDRLQKGKQQIKNLYSQKKKPTNRIEQIFDILSFEGIGQKNYQGNFVENAKKQKNLSENILYFLFKVQENQEAIPPKNLDKLLSNLSQIFAKIKANEIFQLPSEDCFIPYLDLTQLEQQKKKQQEIGVFLWYIFALHEFTGLENSQKSPNSKVFQISIFPKDDKIGENCLCQIDDNLNKIIEGYQKYYLQKYSQKGCQYDIGDFNILYYFFLLMIRSNFNIKDCNCDCCSYSYSPFFIHYSPFYIKDPNNDTEKITICCFVIALLANMKKVTLSNYYLFVVLRATDILLSLGNTVLPT